MDKIIVKEISKSLMAERPKDGEYKSEEAIAEFASKVFKECFTLNTKIDTTKLAKDYDNDELTYDPNGELI